MKSRIIIVTFFLSPNYGSMLQSTALNIYLANQGYEVSFLRRFLVWPYFVQHPRLLWTLITNKLMSGRRKRFFEPYPYSISTTRKQRLSQYYAEHYHVLNITSSKQWRQIIAEDTCFMTGSDIIWQPANGYPGKFFLDFVYYEPLRKIAYASSLGATSLPKKYYRAYRKYLGGFQRIAVREENAATLLEAIIGRRVEQVIDPTLLLNVEEWDHLTEKAQLSVTVQPGQYIICYFVMADARYWSYVKKIKESTGLQVVVLPMHKDDEVQPYTIVLDGTPYEYLWLIKYAALVVTDSFHTCVFSLLYQKEFYLLKRTRKDEDAKYDDFLSRYGLMSRRVIDETKFVRVPETDFSLANEQLTRDRAAAYAYLAEALTSERG